MKFHEVLKKRRQELGLTQEAIAERLGVSTPAVNKWEKGRGYPDIGLLTPLARLLKSDLNELLGFFSELSLEESLNITGDIFKKGLDYPWEKILEEVKELLRLYPTSYELHLELAKTLEALMLLKDEKREDVNALVKACYELASEATDHGLVLASMEGMFRQYLREENFEKAEEILAALPDPIVDKKLLKKTLYRKQGEKDKLTELLQGEIYYESRQLSFKLLSLAELSKEEGKKDEVGMLKDKAKILLDAFEMEDLQRELVMLQFSVLLEEKEEAIKSLDKLYQGAKRGFTPSSSFLYSKVVKKESEDFSQLFLKMLPSGLKEKEFDFLREEKEFIHVEEKILKTIEKLST